MKRTYRYYPLTAGGPVTNRVQSLRNENAGGSVSYWSGTYRYDYSGNVRDTIVDPEN